MRLEIGDWRLEVKPLDPRLKHAGVTMRGAGW